MDRNTNTLAVVTLALGLAWTMAPRKATAALQLRGYTPAHHDRFENDPLFIADPYDLSGVTLTGRWATMITPKHFLTAKHHRPADGAAMHFYHGNDIAGPFETHTVLTGQDIGGDLYMGELSTEVSSDIAIYPILNPAAAPGSEIFVMGQAGGGSRNERMGRNLIDRIELDFVTGIGTGHIFTFDYDELGSPTGLGNDEARVASGDSGAPSFAVHNGSLALVGIHWFAYEDDTDMDFGDALTGSGDSYVSGYYNDINAALAGTGYSASLTPVPEPTGIAMLTFLTLPWTVSRRRRRRTAVSDAVC